MTSRTCIKCGDELNLNSKLDLMECVSGKHIEPVNLIRPQWWNMCPKCGQLGTNDKDGEALFQVLKKDKNPVLKKVGDKKYQLVFERNLNQVPVTCKACGNSFTKKSAVN